MLTRILLLLTSHDQLDNSGQKTAFWLEKFVALQTAFKAISAEITIVSHKKRTGPSDSEEESMQKI